MPEPLWRGPLIDGISQSMLASFIQCPYRSYLKFILGLKDKVELHPNLIWGDCCHKGLEHLITSLDVNHSINLMKEYMYAKYPQVPSTYEISIARSLRNYDISSLKNCSWETEIVFDRTYSIGGRSVRLRGKLDGLTTNHPDFGSCLIEHKTKGYVDAEQTRLELSEDLQLNFYMQLHDVDWVIYDLLLIPEAQKYSPARSFNETPQDWMNRLFTGPCGKYGMFPINTNKGTWQQRITQSLPPEKRAEYWETFIEPLILRFCEWYEHVTQPDFDLADPKYYNSLFYRIPPRMFNGSFTEKYQCDYYKHLIGEQTLEDLVPVPSLFSELEDL